MAATGDIRAGRLTAEALAESFADLHPPLAANAARLAAERCLFCWDAPCVAACPTGIDIPLFIRQIAGGDPAGAGRTILGANILGGMCARVCPTETLCEGACVRHQDEGAPVAIGLLQRHATDTVMASGAQPFRRAAATGRRVAVVGAGPAGLACAHALALRGHDVVLFEARPRGGGLNEHGIAAYKTVGGFAQAELAWLLGIGGIELRCGMALGRDMTLGQLRAEFDAVFLGLGLQAVNALGVDHPTLAGVVDAIAFIERLRQAQDLAALPVGRRVVVIGGGMTAIDAAVQARKLGAEEVTIVYRRGPEAMPASRYEQEVAQTAGVLIRHWARPVALLGEAGILRAVRFAATAEDPRGRLVDSGTSFELEADQLMKAIGQQFVNGPIGSGAEPADADAAGIALEQGRIRVDAERRTSLPGVWAGGDCIQGGSDLTVVAVEDGKRAAASIDRALAPTLAAAAE